MPSFKWLVGWWSMRWHFHNVHVGASYTHAHNTLSDWWNVEGDNWQKKHPIRFVSFFVSFTIDFFFVIIQWSYYMLWVFVCTAVDFFKYIIYFFAPNVFFCSCHRQENFCFLYICLYWSHIIYQKKNIFYMYIIYTIRMKKKKQSTN